MSAEMPIFRYGLDYWTGALATSVKVLSLHFKSERQLLHVMSLTCNSEVP